MTTRISCTILILFAVILSFGQIENICTRVVEIDSSEFRRKFVACNQLEQTSHFKKVNGEFTIATKNRAYTFSDLTEHGESLANFSVISKNDYRNWVWVEEKGLHSSHYFLINTKTSRIDTLIGKALVFETKIISLEDGYTDSPRKVEIYRIKKGELVKLRELNLNTCNQLCCIDKIYLRGKTIFLASSNSNETRAWRIKVL